MSVRQPGENLGSDLRWIPDRVFVTTARVGNGHRDPPSLLTRADSGGKELPLCMRQLSATCGCDEEWLGCERS